MTRLPVFSVRPSRWALTFALIATSWFAQGLPVLSRGRGTAGLPTHSDSPDHLIGGGMHQGRLGEGNIAMVGAVLAGGGGRLSTNVQPEEARASRGGDSWSKMSRSSSSRSMGDSSLISLVLHHCSAIYVENSSALAAWTCSRCTIPPVQAFQMVSLVSDLDAELQAYVGLQHKEGLVIVVFRGTHATYLKNWVDDLAAWELDLNYPQVDHALVHRGFYYAYHQTKLRPHVTFHVLRLLAQYPNYELAITGHSLGAALATLSALDLAVSFKVPADKLWVRTFGSPRVGNSVFAAFFNKTLPRSQRITHDRDLVVHLPPHVESSGLLAYHHVAQEIWFHRLSPFSRAEACRTCDGSGEDPTCSASVQGSSILDHLVYLGVPLCNERTENLIGGLKHNEADVMAALSLRTPVKRKIV